MKKVYEKDIHERIYAFVVRVLNLLNYIPKAPQNVIIIQQLTRSVTSIGANDREADGVNTKKDFIHKYTIVRKEAKETDYWLSLISDTNPKLSVRMYDIIREGKEIIKIVSSIINNTKYKDN